MTNLFHSLQHRDAPRDDTYQEAMLYVALRDLAHKDHICMMMVLHTALQHCRLVVFAVDVVAIYGVVVPFDVVDPLACLAGCQFCCYDLVVIRLDSRRMAVPNFDWADFVHVGC